MAVYRSLCFGHFSGCLAPDGRFFGRPRERSRQAQAHESAGYQGIRCLGKMLTRRVTLQVGESKASMGSGRPDPGCKLAAQFCSQILIHLPLLSKGSKGANKDGGGCANSRGGSTPPALGDLFAGGFPVLRPAGQRDAAGKEEFRLAAL